MTPQRNACDAGKIPTNPDHTHLLQTAPRDLVPTTSPTPISPSGGSHQSPHPMTTAPLAGPRTGVRGALRSVRDTCRRRSAEILRGCGPTGSGACSRGSQGWAGACAWSGSTFRSGTRSPRASHLHSRWRTPGHPRRDESRLPLGRTLDGCGGPITRGLLDPERRSAASRPSGLLAPLGLPWSAEQYFEIAIGQAGEARNSSGRQKRLHVNGL